MFTSQAISEPDHTKINKFKTDFARKEIETPKITSNQLARLTGNS